MMVIQILRTPPFAAAPRFREVLYSTEYGGTVLRYGAWAMTGTYTYPRVNRDIRDIVQPASN